MLLSTGFTVAHKCSSCGAFEFSNISIFKMNSGKTVKHRCRHCKKTCFKATVRDNSYYELMMPCIGCGGQHEFLLDRKFVINGETTFFSCNRTGMKLCFAGKDAEVRALVDNLENELDNLISMFGYENYFKNTRVMLDTLNIIHDIAEKKNLYCECGNRDIELVLLTDKVKLKCKNCFRWGVLEAATNEDLKSTIQKRKICLSGKFIQGIISGKGIISEQ